MSITALLPTLPTYIVEMGGTKQQVGIVMGSFAIGLLLSRTWLGRIADHRSRKIVVLIGTLVAMSAPLGYLLLDSIPGLMLIRAYHGISIAAFTTGYSSLVVDLSPVKQRGEIIGYMTLGMPLGMAIGPALGGFIQADMGDFPLFLVSGVLSFFAFLLTLSVKDSKQQHKSAETAIVPLNLTQLLTRRGIGVLTFVLFLIGLVFGNLAAFVPLFIQEELQGFNVGLFYTIIAIASFSARIGVGGISDIYGRGLFISASLCCYIVSMTFLTIADSPRSLILAAIFEGAGGGVLIPMVIALMSDRCHSWERGRVFALCIGGFDLGIALAGPILGFFAEPLGYRGLFGISIVLSVLALLSFIFFCNKNLRNSYRFAFGQAEDLYALD
ncbi:arabinose efflux permease family protein [Gloeocapsa sp. PCC 73106]|nr:arabinose efflux permease family protein [Gloeocapsa sp. PCC 73106]